MIYSLTKPTNNIKHFSNKFISNQSIVDGVIINNDTSYELNVGQIYSGWFNYSDSDNYIIKNGNLNNTSNLMINSNFQDFYFSKNTRDEYGNISTTTYYIVGEFLDNLESRVESLESLESDTINGSSGTDLTEVYIAGEELTEGDFCVLNTDGKMYKTNSLDTKSKGLLRISTETINIDGSGDFTKYGLQESTTTTTIGGIYYLSGDGSVTETIPSTSGEIVRIVGYGSVDGYLMLDIESSYGVIL